MGKIPFHIISGFLGSGKTTFLKRIVELHATDTKIGFIQNEFAPVSIDGAELKKSGKNFHLLEISNGSVFCVCLLGTFVRSLEKFIDEFEPEILIIEASGLSDTTAVAEVVSSGKLNEKIYLASNWCVVDAINFSKVGLMKQRVVHQLRMADAVIINKTDQVEQKEIDEIRAEIKKLNPFAEIKETTYCNTGFELKNKSINKIYFGEMKPLPRPVLNSMVIKTSRKVTLESLIGFLNYWAPKAYRIKGFVNLADHSTVSVQCTFEQVEIQKVETDLHQTELIALTEYFSLREWNQAFKALE